MTLISKQKAILFADVADSTAIYERLGDSIAVAAIERCLELMSAQVTRWQGVVVKKIGDEIMAVFPTAAEAFEAAQGMQTDIDNQSTTNGVKFAIKIGFHFGHVLEGELDFWGDAVNTAARLAALARRDQILTTATTIPLLLPKQLLDTRELAALNVKGKKAAVPVFEVTWRDDLEKTQAAPAVRRQVAAARLRLRLADADVPVPADKSTIWLGRDNTCELVILEQSASRRHARIERRDGQFFLVDDSTNGTYVRDAEAAEVLLRREQVILRGRGSISLGTSNTSAIHVLHFECA